MLDARGVQVPGTDDAVHVSVGGAARLAGADNGRQDDAEGYTSPTRHAFNGLMPAIVQAHERPGPIHVTATAPALRGPAMTLSADRSPRG